MTAPTVFTAEGRGLLVREVEWDDAEAAGRLAPRLRALAR